MDDPDQIFANAQKRIEADIEKRRLADQAIAARCQANNVAADRLLRRFAERMRGTERTRIVIREGSQREKRIKLGRFRSAVVMETTEGPSVRGWAFVTKDFLSTSTTRDETSPYLESVVSLYNVLAVDTAGQLYLAEASVGPRQAPGLVEATDVKAWGLSPRGAWNGVGTDVLGWCKRWPGVPSHGATAEENLQLYNYRRAEFEALADRIADFLAPGLAAVLSAIGR